MSDELNEAVARKLGIQCAWTDPLTGEPDHAHKIPAYSTSIAAAWEIVNQFHEFTLGTQLREKDCWFCEIRPQVGELVRVNAETPMLAICAAFLKLKGAE